jgi:hypothetical protein
MSKKAQFGFMGVQRPKTPVVGRQLLQVAILFR